MNYCTRVRLMHNVENAPLNTRIYLTGQWLSVWSGCSYRSLRLKVDSPLEELDLETATPPWLTPAPP